MAKISTPKLSASFVALLGVVLLVTLGWFVLRGDKVLDEYRLPIIAVFAMAAMFVVLAFVAAIFKSSELASTSQALGLPRGSVRALIAISLIIIFAVLTLFVLSRLSVPGKTCAELAALLKSAPASEALTKAMDLVESREKAGQDLAKQLLTMLGTLLAAISSFYFGSSSASGAMKPTNGAPRTDTEDSSTADEEVDDSAPAAVQPGPVAKPPATTRPAANTQPAADAQSTPNAQTGAGDQNPKQQGDAATAGSS